MKKEFKQELEKGITITHVGEQESKRFKNMEKLTEVEWGKFKKAHFKHKVESLNTEEVLANRSNAYEFIDFGKQETLEEVGMYQQELFNYLHDLGIIALQSEMQEIERIVLSMRQERMYSKQETENIAKEAYKIGIRGLSILDFEILFNEKK